jgi:hypothetical protein
MVKGGLRAVKVSDGRVKFAGRVDSKLAGTLGDAAARKLKELIKTGKPLNATALKALLGHRNAQIAKQLVEFAQTRAGSKGTQLKVASNQKIEYKGAPQAKISNPFANKSSKFINLEKVTISKGTVELKKMIDDLAKKFGVSKAKLAKAPIIIRLAENEAEDREANVGDTKIGNVMGNYSRRKVEDSDEIKRTITVSAAFLQDVLEKEGKDTAGVLVHELGHYLVELKKPMSALKRPKTERESKDRLAEHVAEEMAVEMLAQSLTDSRNKLGYSSYFMKVAKGLADEMGIPIKDATYRIISIGLREKMPPKDRKVLVRTLSDVIGKTKSSFEYYDVDENIQARDATLDAALDIFEAKGFEVNRVFKSKEAEDYRTPERYREFLKKHAEETMQKATQKSPAFAVAAMELKDNALHSKDVGEQIDARRQAATVVLNDVGVESIVNTLTSDSVKGAALESKLFTEIMGFISRQNSDVTDNVKRQVDVAYAEGVTKRFRESVTYWYNTRHEPSVRDPLSKWVPDEKIQKIIDRATAPETMRRVNMLAGASTYLPVTVTSKDMFVGGIMGASLNDFGGDKERQMQENADLVYAARYGDEAAVTELQQKFPEGYKALNEKWLSGEPKQIEQAKLFEQVIQNSGRSASNLLKVDLLFDDESRAVKSMLQRLPDEKEVVSITGNPKGYEIIEDFVKGYVQTYLKQQKRD